MGVSSGRPAARFFELARSQGLPLRRSEPLSWLTGRGHLAVEGELPDDVRHSLAAIFDVLGGDAERLAAKPPRSVAPDFLLGDALVEFDEVQHFTIQRLATFALYPPSAVLGFDRVEYARLCLAKATRAGRAFAHKEAPEFPGPDSRARQRSYFDALRDLAAPVFGHGPVLRVAAVDRDPVAALERFSGRLVD